MYIILTFIWDEVLRTVSLADILFSWLDFSVDAPEPPKAGITNTAWHSPSFGREFVVTGFGCICAVFILGSVHYFIIAGTYLCTVVVPSVTTTTLMFGYCCIVCWKNNEWFGVMWRRNAMWIKSGIHVHTVKALVFRSSHFESNFVFLPCLCYEKYSFHFFTCSWKQYYLNFNIKELK